MDLVGRFIQTIPCDKIYIVGDLDPALRGKLVTQRYLVIVRYGQRRTLLPQILRPQRPHNSQGFIVLVVVLLPAGGAGPFAL
jgi:hypothetical protein